jgi:hypothetical protein
MTVSQIALLANRKRFVRSSNCQLSDAIFRITRGITNADQEPEIGRD